MSLSLEKLGGAFSLITKLWRYWLDPLGCFSIAQSKRTKMEKWLVFDIFNEEVNLCSYLVNVWEFDASKYIDWFNQSSV